MPAVNTFQQMQASIKLLTIGQRSALLADAEATFNVDIVCRCDAKDIALELDNCGDIDASLLLDFQRRNNLINA